LKAAIVGHPATTSLVVHEPGHLTTQVDMTSTAASREHQSLSRHSAARYSPLDTATMRARFESRGRP
jgi:hypothetical protein